MSEPMVTTEPGIVTSPVGVKVASAISSPVRALMIRADSSTAPVGTVDGVTTISVPTLPSWTAAAGVTAPDSVTLTFAVVTEGAVADTPVSE